MHHRHLNHENFTLAGIDDVIARGGKIDWLALKDAAADDPSLYEKIIRICQAHVADVYAQRFHFWLMYAQQQQLS